MKIIYFLTPLLIFINCATVKQVINPLENPLTSWIFDKSCISVDIPPITLTSEKTIIEKQLLGENIEIAKDGWLLSTPNYVAPIREETLILEPEVQQDFEFIEIYKEIVESYLIRGYLGIDNKGNLKVVPEILRGFTELKHLRISRELATIMNQKKTNIYQYLEKKYPDIAFNFLENYYNLFKNYGWKYDDKKGWIK